MSRKKKVPEAEKGYLSEFENQIIHLVVQALTPENGNKLKNQLSYLILIKRIFYKNVMAIELYPERFDGIPESALFGRREEFCLANLKLQFDNQIYYVDIFLVLGSLIEIRISPLIRDEFFTGSVHLLSISLASELDKNIL